MCWESLAFRFRQSPVGGRGELGRTWVEHYAIVRLGMGCGWARRQRGLGPHRYWGTLGKKLHPLSFSVLLCRVGIHPTSFLGDCMGIHGDDKARGILSPGHSKTSAGRGGPERKHSSGQHRKKPSPGLRRPSGQHGT